MDNAALVGVVVGFSVELVCDFLPRPVSGCGNSGLALAGGRGRGRGASPLPLRPVPAPVCAGSSYDFHEKCSRQFGRSKVDTLKFSDG